MDMYLEKMFNFGSNQEGSWVVYIAVTAGHFMRVRASFQVFAIEQLKCVKTDCYFLALLGKKE